MESPYIHEDINPIDNTNESRSVNIINQAYERDINLESRKKTNISVGEISSSSHFSSYSFEPAALKPRKETSSIERTLNHWIEMAKFTVALPVVSAIGVDLVSKNKSFSNTRSVFKTYSRSINWTVTNTPKIIDKAKSLARKQKK